MRNCVPASWAICELSDVADVLSGFGFPKRFQGRKDAEIPFFKVGDISRAVLSGENFLRKAQHYITKDEMSELRARLLPEHSVVFAKIGEAVKLNRRAILAHPSLVDNNVMGLVAKQPVVLPAYLFWFMQTVHLGRMSQATTVPSVRKGDVQRIGVSLAPLPEQHRIVEAIESYLTRLDDAVASLERVQRNLERYRASVLKAAVEGRLVPTEAELARQEGRSYEPAEDSLMRIETPPRPSKYKSRSRSVILGDCALAVGNPETPLPAGWMWVPIVDIARMESGHTPSRRHPEWWDGDIPWIGIKDARVHNGGHILETIQHTNEAGLANSAARLLPKETVCLSRTASVGYVVITGRPMATSQDFVNWICTDAVDPRWLQLVFLAEHQALPRFGKGTVHTTIYYPEVLSLNVALPPLSEQRRIIQEADALMTILDKLDALSEKSRKRVPRVRQSILKWAFEGKLVEQDPKDEPASVLLERIRSETASAKR